MTLLLVTAVAANMYDVIMPSYLPATACTSGCAPWTAYSAQIEAVIAQFGDGANRTVHLDWGDFSKVARGCYNHPSIVGHRTMADAVVAAIGALQD